MGYITVTSWWARWRTNHRRLDCLPNRLFRRRSKTTLKLIVTGLCEGNPPVPSRFSSQRANNAENFSIWWCHHDYTYSFLSTFTGSYLRTFLSFLGGGGGGVCEFRDILSIIKIYLGFNKNICFWILNNVLSCIIGQFPDILLRKAENIWYQQAYLQHFWYMLTRFRGFSLSPWCIIPPLLASQWHRQ